MATSTALARRQKTSLGSVDDTNARQAARARHRSLRQLVRRLIASIRDGDERTIGDAVLQLSKKRRIFAPLALAVGAFVMLFSGLRLLVTNWRLMLLQVLPAMLTWATTMDLKAHVLQGKEFHDIRRPVVLVLFAAAVLVTTAASYLNAAFAFAVSQPGPPQLRTGFEEAQACQSRSVLGSRHRSRALGCRHPRTTMGARLVRAPAGWRPTGFVDTYIMPFTPFSCQLRVHTRRASDTPVPSESSDDCSTLPRIRTKPA